MLTIEQDTQISELSTDEYFYLTENLEHTDKNSVAKAACFLVFNKKRKLIEIVKTVLENELSEYERDLALSYWADGESATKLAEKYKMGRSTVYRNLDNAKKKLKTSLKYVLIYDKNSLPQSAEELLQFIERENVGES